MRIVEFDWYWGGGLPVNECVERAILWYNKTYPQPANFVQLCDVDLKSLGLNGALRGVTVYRGGSREESGSVMVGRMERC